MTATPVDKTYIMLMVADMQRALRFYTEALSEVMINSPYWSEFIVAGANIALHAGGSGAETRTGLGFEVQDLDVALDRAIEVGGRITSPTRERAESGFGSPNCRYRRQRDHRRSAVGVASQGSDIHRRARHRGKLGRREPHRYCPA